MRQTGPVPFPDERFAQTVEVVPYQAQWARDGAELVERLWGLLPEAPAVDHIGSTAVPHLPAKDCLDVMVRVRSLDVTALQPLSDAGFRERPEHWNHTETLGGVDHPKRVFAPPAGARSVNIHVREAGSATSRYALLFRDYLRSAPESRQAWGTFKLRLAEAAPDIYAYGQVKATAQPLLMELAERWAAETAWAPDDC